MMFGDWSIEELREQRLRDYNNNEIAAAPMKGAAAVVCTKS